MTFTTPMPFSALSASTCAALIARWASSTAESNPKDLSITYFRYEHIKHRLELNKIILSNVNNYRNIVIDRLRNASNRYFQTTTLNFLRKFNLPILLVLFNHASYSLCYLEYNRSSLLRPVSSNYVNLIDSSILNTIDDLKFVVSTSRCSEDGPTALMYVIDYLRVQDNRVLWIKALVATLNPSLEPSIACTTRYWPKVKGKILLTNKKFF